MYDEFTPDIFEEMWVPHHAELIGNEGLSNGEETEIGVSGYGQSFGVEIGEQDAIHKTVARARDNRRCAPPMKAVDLDDPLFDSDEWGLIDLCGADADPFPLITGLIKKYGEGSESKPRIVRVDTEESYRAFRTADSPERTALLSRLSELEAKVSAHVADPHAHAAPPGAMEEDLAEAVEMSVMVSDIEDRKKIPLRMPRHFDGLLEAWHEGGLAGASMVLPKADGGRWVVTSAEPIEAGMLEAAKAATEAGVRASDIVGYLPAIGATLAAGDAVKTLASGAESILQRPEAKGDEPFMVRLEPKTSPALYALGTLARMCARGDQQACDEWNRLAQAAPLPLQQAMAEILMILKSPPTAIGGKVGDFFNDLWAKIRRFFGTA